MQLGKPAEAIPDWNRALALDDGRERWRFRQRLAKARIQAGELTQALTEINNWVGEKGISPAQLLIGARLCALAIDAAKDQQTRDQCAERAIALLREATSRGFADIEALRKGDDFKNLQDRDGFQTLLKELQSKTQPQ
jgi:hypothetical protein